MGDPISLVVKPIVDNTIKVIGSLIKEEYHMVHGVKAELRNLSDKLSTIQSVLIDAEEKQLDDPPVRDWLGKLKDAADDAEDILDTFATEASVWKLKPKANKFLPTNTPSKISFKSSVAHMIKQISARLDVIAKEKDGFHLNIKVDAERSKNHPQAGWYVDTSTVVGREADHERMINLLLSNEFDKEDDVSLIPIIGMGGLGKTTLAQFVFNDERVKDHFESRMWVSVNVDFNLERIIREMIEFHSKMKYDPNLSLSLLESRLLDFLAGKRFLLVLDDVWTCDYRTWEPLQQLLKQGNKGSRILVTSRKAVVSEIMGTQSPFPLEYLPQDQCWSLFEKIAFKDVNLPNRMREELEDIGKQIVDKCKGLPLAVKAMGGLLRGNTDVKKWQKISRSSVWELEDKDSNTHRPDILPPLKLSYNELPAYLKQCFAYCSIFPKAYVFNKKDLVKLWMAQAFIQSGGQEEPEELGIGYFDELLMRSFFQTFNIDNMERYRMHDLMHDLAQSISTPYCCQVKDNKSSSCTEKSRHVSLLGQDVEESASKIVGSSPKVRTLLFPSELLKTFGQALDKIFRNLKCIRVLDLSSSMLEILPNSIEELKLLRYLDLSGTEIKVLPNSICSLYNLQTLKVLRCHSLCELPKDLGNLINLRHLELDDMFWYKSFKLPQGIGQLKSLHNLHAFRVGSKRGYRIEELKDMASLTGTLHISGLESVVDAGAANLKDKENLEKVVFEWNNKDAHKKVEAAGDNYPEEKVLEDLKPHSNLKQLQIVHYMGTRFPTWMREGVLQNLFSISLIGCTKCKILILGQLPKLGALYIKGMLELEDWPETESRSLRQLKISNCPKLNKLPEIFLNLQVLKIKNCGSLKALPVTPSLMFLKLFDNSVLNDWNEKMVSLISRNDQGQPIVTQKPSLIGLLEMQLVNCPMLQALPQLFFPQKLEISGCQSLSACPEPSHAQRLQHLALDAYHDGTLLKAIPNTRSLYSLVVSRISNIASIPKWPQLPGLKALYIRDCNDLEVLSEEDEEGSLQSLKSLKLLSVQDCPKLKTLPKEGLPAELECLSIGSCPSLQSLGPKELLKNLTSLKDLYIENCPLLESLPEEGLPSSLQHLRIQECPKLGVRCQKTDGADWPHINHIPDLEMDFVKISPAPIGPKKNASSSAWFQPFQSRKGY
ncbi:LRR_1 domain-containing protein/NB-ARC domain-containing protein [Cephalotus follicularis]|uniref:LRR_1 domain-containing protein/NB-ARC domain-containing protein n=1 Tax=Cephalotus follicularis TaxID=3775 RepID=A0A1Q3AP16_CEPFO|nr:LRR_1 domain-containing protein/NB-ARC domain-containing protein [Cephalotus follicularis]